MSGPFGSSQWMYKSGEVIAWGGSRMITAGGTTGNGGSAAGNANSIDYVNATAASGNSVDFGDLSAVRISLMSVSATGRMVFLGGNPSYVNVMEYITPASTGNVTDFGDMLVGSAGNGHQMSNGIRGVWAGPSRTAINGGSYNDEIEYITIASTGNGTDFGNLDVNRGGPAGSSNGIRGIIWAGNIDAVPVHTKQIQYITISSTGNATSFGQMVRIVTSHSACGNADRNICFGGFYGSLQDTIEYINPASTSNTTDFGNLLNPTYMIQGAETAIRGLMNGGYGNVSYENTIQYVTLASTGNATDFGNMAIGRYSHASGSGA
tara:strand:- start:693 stop:1655 length:963 start_codon:yes stop_codon:yes gene_type:complete